jgi:fructose-1,6-bisphosphatase/inositol monophosphatase family enzyme
VGLLTGKAQARIEFGLGVDDVAPLEPIILGAGGIVSCSDGISLSEALSGLNDLSDHVSFGIVCAASRDAHDEILRDLAA